MVADFAAAAVGLPGDTHWIEAAIIAAFDQVPKSTLPFIIMWPEFIAEWSSFLSLGVNGGSDIMMS